MAPSKQYRFGVHLLLVSVCIASGARGQDIDPSWSWRVINVNDPGNFASLTTCLTSSGATITSSFPDAGIFFASCPTEACATAVAAACTSLAAAAGGTLMAATGDGVMNPAGVQSTAADDDVPAGTAAGAASIVGSIDTSQAYSYNVWQWNMKAVNASTAWANNIDGTGVRIAVIDTAMDCDHVELAPNVERATSKSFVGFKDGCEQAVGDAGFHHGTHVAGIAAGSGVHRVLGVAPRATIIPVQVFDLTHQRQTWDVISAAILYAATPRASGGAGADVINLSLGGWYTSKVRHANETAFNDDKRLNMAAVNYAHRMGALVVVAAMNQAADLGSQQSGMWTYAGYPNTLVVSATGPPKVWCPPAPGPFNVTTPAYEYTNYGNPIDIAAPGGTTPRVRSDPCGTNKYDGILSPGSGLDLYYSVVGTSMAAPHVAGAAALVLQRNPGMKGHPSQVKAALLKGAVPTKEFRTYQGSGFLNVPAALGLV